MQNIQNGIAPLITNKIVLNEYLAYQKYKKYYRLRDLFHVYLNRFEFYFLWLHINKTNKFCFFMHNGRVPCIAK